MQKRDFETIKKRFRDLEIRPKFSEVPFTTRTLKKLIITEISVSPGDRQKSPSSRPWRAGYSDPNKKIFILEDGKIHCVNFSLQAR